ncbi:MAG TPA: glycine cleavage system aminomethyltransferase GcvT [Verrucomicrobiota bacterium]|nr:glycine cleavage system aminomethyltransferase GcvT [Verrucomicrobiota bacterium]
MLQRTPLFTAHQRLGGKLVEFGGWEMPVQYSSITDEHLCVRRAAGIFDISHMGEVLVSGAGAEAFLNQTLTNDVRKLAVGLGQYSQMCNETGGTVDDLYVYRLAPDEFLLIINASRIAPDVAWLEQRLGQSAQGSQVIFRNASAEFGAVAIQGPRVVDFITQVFPGPSVGGTSVASVLDLKKNEVGLWTSFEAAVLPVWVARTGYTGEDGFEVVAPAAMIEAIWNRSLAVGHIGCIQPCGLGARDTLRTEMCYPLYGHELDEQTSPLEAGLGVFVSFDKGDFVGRTALLEQKTRGLTKKSVAFKMAEKSAPPRPGYPIFAEGQKVGTVVSGTQSPSLNLGIGLGYVAPEWAASGLKLEIEIRGRRFASEIVKKPIYRKA